MESKEIQLLIQNGKAAMDRAEWGNAVIAFQEASAQQRTPEILEQIGWSAWWLNNPELSFASLGAGGRKNRSLNL